MGMIKQKLVSDLRNRSEEVRLNAAKDISNAVSSAARDESGDVFSKTNDEVNKLIYEFVSKGSDSNEKLGGISLIEALIDIEGEENTQKFTRFHTYLREVLPTSDVHVTLAASRAIGRLVLAGGSLTADMVQFECERSFEWLQQADRVESKRLSAVFTLEQIALNAPALFYNHLAPFFDAIVVAIKDVKLSVRDGAKAALHAVLQLTAQREYRIKAQWYNKIYEDSVTGLKAAATSKDEMVHGSLLIIEELIMVAGDFIELRYEEVCQLVMQFLEHKTPYIARTVIDMLPGLAAINQSAFTQGYLESCINSLTTMLKVPKERGAAFEAIGKLAVEVKTAIVPYIDQIIVPLKQELQVKHNKKAKYHAEKQVLQCIGMLVKGAGRDIEAEIINLIPLMFSSGLSQELTESLSGITANLPSATEEVQEMLLEAISDVLSRPLQGKTKANGMNGHRGSLVAIKSSQINLSMSSASGTLKESAEGHVMKLALNTLGVFEFRGQLITHSVWENVVAFLDNPNPHIRKEAAITLSRLLQRYKDEDQIANSYGHIMNGDMKTEAPVVLQTAEIVPDILEKLLSVAITDPDPTIRLEVLKSLYKRFDKYLAQMETVRYIFLALNDEVFEIRELAVAMVGHLAACNPADCLPTLRKYLLQLLNELEFSMLTRTKEESARLLCHLIANALGLIKPYVDPVLNALVPKLRESSHGLAVNSLAAIGELAQVGGSQMDKYMNTLMALIIETLQDQSSVTKREVAIRTLGQLAQSTGYVIVPYEIYPNLLDLILNFLKSEQAPHIRRELMKVLGILGALDPYKHRVNLAELQDSDAKADQGYIDANSLDNLELVSNLSVNDESYFPTVAIRALMRILRDPSKSAHHNSVIQAVMFIFKSLGLKCVPFLRHVMPALLQVMRTGEQSLREFMFQQLGVLVSIVKQNIREYLNDIFDLIQEYWGTPGGGQITIITLLESISSAFDSEFKVHMSKLLPQIMRVYTYDKSERRTAMLKVLHCLEVFGLNLTDYLHLIITPLVDSVESSEHPVAVRKEIVLTIGRLSRRLNFVDFSSRLIHTFARVLESGPTDLHYPVIDCLTILALQMQDRYIIFVPLVAKAMAVHGIHRPRYEQLVSRIMRGIRLPLDEYAALSNSTNPIDDDRFKFDTGTTIKKLHVNQQNLKRAWEASQRSTKEDWMEWMRRFSVELLRESPSPSLRSCSALAAVHQPLARELFNAAFVSCWTELYEQHQEELVRSLEIALMSPNMPPEILQTLLNLAEFMEHDDKTLPIDVRTLGEYALKCHAYAKALHYKEQEFFISPQNTFEALISINNQLQQPEAATGILIYAQKHHDLGFTIQETWYEKLQHWDEALAAYEKKQETDPNNFELLYGRVRCLGSMGNFEEVHNLVRSHWIMFDDNQKRTLACDAAAAAFALQDFRSVQEYGQIIGESHLDGYFYRAVYHVHVNDNSSAQKEIERTRDRLDVELTALAGESYYRAYDAVVRAQMLSELEEVMLYKKSDHTRREFIRHTWESRLKGVQRDLDIWQRIIRVHSMVLTPVENRDMLLKFVALAQKRGRLDLSEKIIRQLLPGGVLPEAREPPIQAYPKIAYTFLRHKWVQGDREGAYQGMQKFVEHLNRTISAGVAEEQTDALLARCYVNLGHWCQALEEDMTEDTIRQTLAYYEAATEKDQMWYKAWHAFAVMSFEAANQKEKQGTHISEYLDNITSAVSGFFSSISLLKGNSLQDVLRLLTLWFKYGYHEEVSDRIREGIRSERGIRTVSIDTWLQVIPQLIARIHTQARNVRRLISELLVDIGKEHPQALIYPLTVASKSQSVPRREAASTILENMRQHSKDLVDQALLVSQELIRVAILWQELWHEGLEEASKMYFVDQNVEGMFAIVEPLHQMMERGPETMREINFIQAYGKDLKEAFEWCRKFKRTRNSKDILQAWDLYYQVFRQISKQLPSLTSLELQVVSPKLLAATDLELAVPGTYQSGEPLVRIKSFSSSLSVITSKQRPRKLSIVGSDGKSYQYLLKGHEDLRQDERVMQLFGLVNTLLATSPETFQRHLSIRRYAVVPLAPNSGLIGWVSHCDTLHSLIRDYRDSRKILLNIEHRLMLQMAPDYDHLPVLNKIEVFQYALDNTAGTDLAKVLWLRAQDSESWLQRRTNYTRSLATMSIVGYILGLGDRHPSNLMLHRFTGKILHIDFGDCFEVAMHREKFPEKIPFRLTRMLTAVMEVSGIEGNYRIISEAVMRVLRGNKDSLMAVLEAFVYDPLINWRLVDSKGKRQAGTRDSNAGKEGLESEMDESSRKPAVDKPSKHRQVQETEVIDGMDNVEKPEALNERAIEVITRVQAKLTGRDFGPHETLEVPEQVQRLIIQATSHENLCQCYIGWCPFW
eukprot:Clim_evm34s6 gene=Clim_evmTU34s6